MKTRSASTLVFLTFGIACLVATVTLSQTNCPAPTWYHDGSKLSLPALQAAAEHTILAHGKRGGGPIVPSNQWHSAISGLNPIRVRNHGYNLAVVLTENDSHEEGIYLHCSKSSFAVYFPVGTNVSSQVADGYRFTQKMDLVTFSRSKPKKESQPRVAERTR
jgi:hypothetical protein